MSLAISTPLRLLVIFGFRNMNTLYAFIVFLCLASINKCVHSFEFIFQRDSTSDPDVFLNSPQLIRKYNYTVEEHEVTTEDGYKLNIFRIPKKAPPVLLVHGIGDSSDCWLVLGPKHSLAYQLADNGYDVWLFNARGNRYNKENVNKVPDKIFWDFSFEEIGYRDLPRTIDYILNVTSISKLTYIGFSQGTTVFLVMLSLRPEYNIKIEHAILLAPVSSLITTKYPLIDFFYNNLDKLKSLARHIFEVFPFNERLNRYHVAVCNPRSPLRLLCESELFVNFGLKKLTNLLPEKLPVITSHIPAGTSSKLFLHFLQSYKGFRRYDYGGTRNKIVYSSPSPPEYDLSRIFVPVTLITSEVDWFSAIDDVNVLKNKLQNVDKFIVIEKNRQFTHLEFIYGARVNKFINQPVLNILEFIHKV